MRTRYYNPEIKRFINQDTVLGSITNSQSLNRYAYVQGNPISLVDPFGMSPENGKNAIGHTLLDFMGLIPGIGFVFDAANSAWYVAEGNYTMAALAAFAAIPGLGDAVSAGMLATKGAKAAELCKIIKKLGYVAKVAENVGEFAINANNAYKDIKENTVGIDTVASLLAAGLNGFGIYASIKRYNSVSVDVRKVTDWGEGGNKVAEKVSESSSNTGEGEYAAPSGGGWVTSTIKANGQTVNFGHGGRHLEGTGLNVAAVNQALENEVSTLNLGIGQFHKGQIIVDGITIEYASYGVSEGIINVGTYYPLQWYNNDEKNRRDWNVSKYIWKRATMD